MHIALRCTLYIRLVAFDPDLSATGSIRLTGGLSFSEQVGKDRHDVGFLLIGIYLNLAVEGSPQKGRSQESANEKKLKYACHCKYTVVANCCRIL